MLPTGLILKINEVAAPGPKQKDRWQISRMLLHLISYSE